MNPTIPNSIWKPEHLQWLNAHFPEQTYHAEASLLQYQAGQRNVVRCIQQILESREQHAPSSGS
jgi:hypothetical protein